MKNERKNKKGNDMGAIFGGVYSIIGPIIGGVIGIAARSKDIPLFWDMVLLIFAAPAVTYNILHGWLDVYYVYDAAGKIIAERSRGNLGFFVNILLWIGIGALIGVIYGRWRGSK